MTQEPDPFEQARIANVAHAAVKWGLADFLALLLAYGRNGPITDDILVHIREQVTDGLKNASVTGMPLELQATALSRALADLNGLIDNAIERGWKQFSP